MTRVRISVAALLLLTVGCSIVACQSPQDETIAESHIRANVPDDKDFDKFLKRDLETYFKGLKGKSVTVQFDLLRKGPTQSGVAYPKFYAWVTIRDHDGVLEEGAVRVAAVEKKQFDVTDYINKADAARSFSRLRSPDLHSRGARHVQRRYCLARRSPALVYHPPVRFWSRHLATDGEPPTPFSAIRDRCIAGQRAAGGADATVDYIFEVPVELVMSFTGYRYDQDIPELGDQPFEVLESTEPEKKSWSKRLLSQ